jgi:hypothetical protein
MKHMKSKNIGFVISLILLSVFTFQSCTEEEGTIVSYGAFTQPVLVAPANDTYISVAGTTVDLKWESTDAEGDPQNWNVYFGTSATPPRVKTGHTSQTYTATVAKGITYYWRVVGTDANGIPTRSNTWSFKVIDPAADILVDLSWDTDVKTSIGLDLSPTSVVDLRLLIVKESDKSIVATEDGSGFEEYVGFNSLADGTYLIAADIYSTINAGDFNAAVNLDLELGFNQPGIIDQTMEFPQVMTNEYPCDAYRTYLAKVTKTGTSYTVERGVSYMTPQAITWYGIDATYTSEVTTVSGCELLMNMLLGGWMLDWWGEVIIKGGTLVYTVDGSGNVTIPFQYYCTTTYNGAVQPDYSIQGTGTVDNSGAYPVMTLHYDINQGGTWIGHYSYLHYGWEQDGFDAVITLDPNGKGGGKGVSGTVPAPKNLVKPVH